MGFFFDQIVLAQQSLPNSPYPKVLTQKSLPNSPYPTVLTQRIGPKVGAQKAICIWNALIARRPSACA
jgi:hypothetical protein